MVLVAERRHSKINPFCTVFCWFCFGIFDRPACIAIFLRKFFRLVLPVLRDLAGLQNGLFNIRVALSGGRDDRGINDLPTHGQKSGLT